MRTESEGDGQMSNFEKIYSVWSNIEETYASKGQGLSRVEFLKKMIGSDKSIVHLKSMSMKDFTGTEEDQVSINDFFNILEEARLKLENTTEIRNLYDFVFGNIDTVEEVNLSDFTIVDENDDFVSGIELSKMGYYSSVFILHDNSIESKVLSLEDPYLVHFDSTRNVL